MTSYLIEFRFQSKRVKTHLKRIIHKINKRFRVGKKTRVSHISLVGPFTTRNERRLISDFAMICSKTKLMNFKVNGFGTFENNGVIFAKINASTRLNDFRIKLVDTIRSYCKVQPHDKKRDPEKFGYHSTLVRKLNKKQFKKIKKYVMKLRKPKYSQIVIRVTLLKKGKILREYDFMQRRLLNRRQALNRHITRRSKTLLRQFMQGKHDPNRRIRRVTKPKPKSLWERIKGFFGVKNE